jgi:hypothetical protein
MNFNASMAVFLLWQRPLESFAGFGLLLVGYLFYLINKKIEKT